jgi:hypothetical protein
MDAFPMKKITLFLFVLQLFSVVKAQKVYFIYIQSENQQSFYARMGEKVFNSTASGYLILSKLTDSTYSMNIGIQGSQSPEQFFSITVNKKDQGFLLKNFGEKGWGLFNLQSLAVILPASNDRVSIVKTEKRESNAFTDLLAKAADDSTVKEKPVVIKTEVKKMEDPIEVQAKKEELKRETLDTLGNIMNAEVKKPELPVEKKEELHEEIKDTVKLKVDEIKKTEVLVEQKEDIKVDMKPVQQVKTEEKKANQPDQNSEKKTEEHSMTEPYQKSSVIKHSESSTTEGFGLIFLDVYPGGTTDTIRILFPGEKQKPAATELNKEEKKFLDIISQDTAHGKINVGQIEKIADTNSKSEPPGKILQKNNHCLQTADYDDFYKLRKKMAAVINDENMINEAKKIFKSKCFMTEQIRNLSTLFLTDEGKYKFFDMAYSYVSDSGNFYSLQSELKDEYYLNRFKSMLY